MTYYLLKLFVSAGIIVAVSEVAKFNAPLGALIKSLPLISLLAILWLYLETQDTQKIAELSSSTFWLVLPTLPMFLALPALLRAGWGFYPSLALSVAIMVACYAVAVPLLARFGMSI
ncbi:MAG TPA: DUF3147 family protein [Burkholderiales bacterium]|nr:DUF3147 family protein [Burkholderiales bacterium]